MRNVLTCEYCKQTYERPVLLPCGETICLKDIADLYKEDTHNHIIICFHCGNEHRIGSNKTTELLPANKLIERMLAQHLQTFDLGKTYERAKQLVDAMGVRLEEFERLAVQPSQYLSEELETVTSRIRLKKDAVKTLCDTMATKMCEEVTLFRYECESALELSNVKLHLVAELDELKDKMSRWRAQLDKLHIDEKKWHAVYDEALAADTHMQAKMKELRDALFLNVECRFEERQVDLTTNVFGQLRFVSYCIRNLLCLKGNQNK